MERKRERERERGGGGEEEGSETSEASRVIQEKGYKSQRGTISLLWFYRTEEKG